MKRAIAAMAILPMVAAAAPSDRGEPYRILQQANLRLDPALATSAYASDARLIFDYPGQPAETFLGHKAIRSSYVRTFKQVDPGTPIKLDFRFEPPGLAADWQDGIYQLAATAEGRPVKLYGRFSVTLVKEGAAWRFSEDRGTSATSADFERLAPTGTEAK